MYMRLKQSEMHYNNHHPLSRKIQQANTHLELSVLYVQHACGIPAGRSTEVVHVIHLLYLVMPVYESVQ